MIDHSQEARLAHEAERWSGGILFISAGGNRQQEHRKRTENKRDGEWFHVQKVPRRGGEDNLNELAIPFSRRGAP